MNHENESGNEPLNKLFFFTYNTRDQFLFERVPIPQQEVVKVKSVVQVGDGPVVELVQHAHVIDQGLQGLEDGWELQKSVDLEKTTKFFQLILYLL